jgi:competence CoiA-like predicted nuclease
MSSPREREAIRLVRVSNRKLNEIRFSPNERIEHVHYKEAICSYLKAIKKNFYTEAIFETGGRADIFILEDLTVVEIMCSESFESIEAKKKTYPNGLKMIAIQVAP